MKLENIINNTHLFAGLLISVLFFVVGALRKEIVVLGLALIIMYLSLLFYPFLDNIKKLHSRGTNQKAKSCGASPS